MQAALAGWWTPRQSKTRHHQRLDRFGFVFKDSKGLISGQPSVCQPMRQFVHKRQQFLLRIKIHAQRNEITEDSAMHRLGQR